ncbi:phosphotransferase [Amycolatopsis sp. A133]|uniref:phosphotransferase n=1 Tax=Amycolatopsis sp. A133 TaxID=3064472 RepID=UPI0027E5FEFB|nr:phosphotransferase [Amycolatopsis sp. A133]MDQ7802655.1 phosphotransferase [Amycolatopsis sp. A133]
MGTRDRMPLPPAARAAVEVEIGEIRRVEPLASGLNSAFAAVLHTADGAVFVKGMPEGHPGVRGQQREAAIAPHISGIAPRLRWHLNPAGWDLLGFDHLPGHTADLSPGSPDLASLARTLTRLGELEPPPLPLPRIEQRWTGLADDADLALLADEHLLHTDLNPNNILVSDGRAWLVDWAWPTLGAPWVDPACAALWLIAEGHTPTAAETWARTLPAWTRVPRDGLDTFVAVSSRLWTTIADDDAQPWKLALRNAANLWLTHRSS